MRPPIHSKKHYVQLSQSQVSQSAVLVTTVLLSAETPSSTPTTIEEGAIVKAVYAEVWASNASSSLIGSFTAGMYKSPGDGNAITAGEAAALHDWANKKNLLYTTQALVAPTDGGLLLLYKGWIKIPKGKQRFGLNDKMQWFLRNNNATAVDIETCGIFIFKEYT